MIDARSRGLALLAFAALASGCSGGPAANSTPAQSHPSQPASAQKVLVTIRFATTASGAATSRNPRTRQRDYVSPATLGAVVTATSTTPANAANDTTTGYDISTNNPNCTYAGSGGALDCTLSIPLAIDTYSIELDTYDQNDSGLPAGLGTELSTDTETESVTASAAANAFTFNPHAFVAGFVFYLDRKDKSGVGRRAPSSRRPMALSAPVAGIVNGVEGGFSDLQPDNTAALDPDGYEIDVYPDTASFVNGTFAVAVAEPADTTGCSSAEPCASAANALGTSYAPSVASTAPAATIPLPIPSDEDLELAYSGGGSQGAGIVNWPAPAPASTPSAPTGTRPYYADISIPNPDPSVSPYVVPHTYFAPLFAYASVGAGMPFEGTADGQNVYVWAAQALIPNGAATDGSSYAASFGGNSTCVDSNANTAAEIVGQNYYIGYGAVFTIETFVNQGNGSAVGCTVTVTDGAGDEQNVSIAVETTTLASRRAPAPNAALRHGAGR